MVNTMIVNSLAHMRYDTTYRPLVDTSDIIGVEGKIRQTKSPSLLSIWKIVVDSPLANGDTT